MSSLPAPYPETDAAGLQTLLRVLGAPAHVVVVIDARGQVLDGSPAATERFGGADAGSCLHLGDLVSGLSALDESQLIDGLSQRVARGDVVSARDGQGRHRPSELSVWPVVVDGEVRALVQIRDAASANARAAAEHALERRSQELREFVYIASHDLAAPLRAIGQLATWIEEDAGEVLTGEVHENLVMLRSRVDRLHRLLDGLLQYSRAFESKEEHGLVDLGLLLDGVRQDVALPKGFLLRLEGLGLLTARRHALRQVIGELVANAVHHHDRDTGEIVVSVTAAGGNAVRIAVSDDGPGIPASAEERIFRPFQTLRAKDATGRVGMGLAIVKRRVELLGGEIGVEARAERGTVITIYLPRAAVPRAEATP